MHAGIRFAPASGVEGRRIEIVLLLRSAASESNGAGRHRSQPYQPVDTANSAANLAGRPRGPAFSSGDCLLPHLPHLQFQEQDLVPRGW
eukprot:6215887-Pyramimonas_sp.AAC.1